MISIHALREEGDADVVKQRVDFLISIHALREEGDVAKSYSGLFEQQFLSTPSARRATFLLSYLAVPCIISIHALREEGDVQGSASGADRTISIHALREEGDSLIR